MIVQTMDGFSHLRKVYRGNPSSPQGKNCIRIGMSCEDQITNDAGEWVTREGSLNDRFFEIDIKNDMFVNRNTLVLCQETDEGAEPAYNCVQALTVGECGGTEASPLFGLEAVLVEHFLLANGFVTGTSVL